MPNQCSEVSIDSNPQAGAPTWPAAENPSTVNTKPSEQGQTVMWPLPKAAAGVNITGIGNELIPANSLQPPNISGTNQAGTLQLFQEIQMFIGEVARIMGISPRAAWFQIRTLGELMFRRN